MVIKRQRDHVKMTKLKVIIRIQAAYKGHLGRIRYKKDMNQLINSNMEEFKQMREKVYADVVRRYAKRWLLKSVSKDGCEYGVCVEDETYCQERGVEEVDHYVFNEEV